MEQKIDVMIDEATVEARITEIAQQLSKEYEGKTIHIIGVLKGSVRNVSIIAWLNARI